MILDSENTERNPKDHRLFHYTRKLDHLEDMLRNGLWPRYCEEDFEWLIGQPVTLAFPTLSFCDIPLAAAGMHRNRYGDYAIGFSKNWLESFDINPIWYVHPKSGIGRHLARNLRPRNRFNLDTFRGHPLRNILAFLKPTIGFQRDRTATREDITEVFACDEEMEWRHTPSELSNRWFQDDDRGFVTEEHHNISREHRLRLEFDHIDCIVVSEVEEGSQLAAKFPALKHKIQTW